MNASRFVGVHAVFHLSPSDELLIKYKFHREPNSRKKYLALGLLPLDVPLEHKKWIIK